MSETNNFLFELQTEEIPSVYQKKTITDWRQKLPVLLKESLLEYSSIEVGGTAKRIYVLLKDLNRKQSEKNITLKGPPKSICFKDGNPTKALEGFAKKAGVSVGDVEFKAIDNSDYAVANVVEGGNDSKTILPELLSQIILDQKFPKTMRWSNLSLLYARPIVSYLAMLDNEQLSFEGKLWNDIRVNSKKVVQIGNQSANTVIIENSNAYVDTLETSGILVNQEKRRQHIVEALKEVAKEKTVIIPEDLLDEVTYLVESPQVVVGEFPAEFLKLPDVLIISEMQEHQRYFAMREKSGKLSSQFLIVVNSLSTDPNVLKNIVAGNERVVKARLSDGAYFFNEDRKKKLNDRIEDLHKVVYLEGFGSLFDKKERMKSIAADINEYINPESKIEAQIISRCADLLKVDLTTLLVYEFDHLQGEIGAIYAELDGEPKEICLPIIEQYLPRNQNDEYPNSQLGICFSITEKLDNLVGGFLAGKSPTSAQDPLGLRRQTLYMIEIFIKNKIHLPFKTLLKKSIDTYQKDSNVEIVDEIWDFVLGRISTIFEKQNIDKKLIHAGLMSGSDDLYDIYLKLSALKEVKEDENFNLLMGGFKRMNNIVVDFAKQSSNLSQTLDLTIDASLFEQEEEKMLFKISEQLKEKIGLLDKTKKSYEEFFTFLASTKGNVDDFFDSVMVMHEDLQIRNNRVAILQSVVSDVKKLLDVSVLQ